MDNRDSFIPLKQAVQYLPISYDTLLSLVQSKKIPTVKIGKREFLRKETIEELQKAS